MRWPWSRRRTFDSTPKPIDDLFRELYASTGTTVTRADALSVPAVRRGRNMLCAIATMPLEQVDATNTVVASALLRQIDPDVANVVTLSQTIEDLIFDAESWWLVTAVDFAGYPMAAQHLDRTRVSLTPPGEARSPLPAGHDPRGAAVWVDGQPVSASQVIRFDSPNPAVLKHAGREIRRAILLDKAAGMYADDPRPSDYFSPADGADPVDDDEAKEIVTGWRAARKARATAWVPAALKYNTVDAPNPQQLQLAELSKQASLDIANSMGIDPEDLGISTTSRTYSNDVDRRRNKLNDVLKPYMAAIEHRLSMGDVTRRGYRVRFNTTEYLMPNPGERWAIYSTPRGQAVITDDEVREAEGMGPRPVGAEPAPEPDASANLAEPSEADRPPAHTFDGPTTFTLDAVVEEFSVDRDNRIIEGVAVPYGQVGSKDGVTFRFDRGSLQWAADNPGRVKLVYPRHGDAVGKAIQLKDTPRGLLTRFKVGRGAQGDQALMSAEDGVFDGLSIGVDFDARADVVPDPRNRGAMLVKRADLRHVALTDAPVFDNARVTHVAASRDKEGTVPDTETPESVEVPAPETPEPTAQVGQPVTFSLEQVQQLLSQAATPVAPEPEVERPAVVDPTRRLDLSVTEPASYRFSRSGSLVPAAHDFGIDFVKAVHPDHRDQAAYDRVMSFVQAQFDVVSGNVNELNPTINVPRYIDEREFVYPIYNAVSRGAPPNGIQPFQWPKFSSASGLVAAHTEGTEPTSGTYVTTSQPVTPVPLSGKAKISREVWDMGGVPGVGDIIWRRITRDWYETIEAAIVTMLDAASPTSLGTFTIGGGTTGQTLAAEMVAALALLQFARGGFRFDTAFAEAGLYTELAGALDDAGRPLFPMLGAQNSSGDVSARWSGVNVGGVPFLPAWALGATVGAVADSSYLIDRTAVDCWTTPPMRLTFDMTEVANVYIGVWGYHAEAINDLAGVREISYDPAV